MLDKFVAMLPTVMIVLGSLVTALAAISPLTKTDIDNKILDFFRKLQAIVAGLIGVKASK